MLPKVRAFSAEDVKTVAQMLAQEPDGWSETALADSLANSSIKSFVLEADGVAAAFVSFLVADDAELVFVVTDRNYRHRGFARELLGEALKQIALPCVLEVRESNTPAIKLYEGMGFRLIGRRNGFYSGPKEAALIYKLDL